MDNGKEIIDRQVALQWYNHLCEKWGSYYDYSKARQEISSIYDDNFKRHFEKLFGTQSSDTGNIFHYAELSDREENPFVAPAKDHLFNVVLNGLNEELLQIIQRYKFKVTKNYLLACVESGSINSFCTRVPFSD